MPDDPFDFNADNRRTIYKPVPGGSRGPSTTTGASRQRTGTPEKPSGGGATTGFGGSAAAASPAGLAAPVQAAGPLLNLLAQVRGAVSHPDPVGLLARASEEVKALNARLRMKGVNDEMVFLTQYVMCTVVDEAVLNTPWGADSEWASNGLLPTFHKERDGGVKFFTLLAKLRQESEKYLSLLELMYTCLSLGFEGKYRIEPEGRRELVNLRENLYGEIRARKTPPPSELSEQWRGIDAGDHTLEYRVPLWSIALGGLGLLIVVYFGLNTSLNAHSDPLPRAIVQIPDNPPPTRIVQVVEPEKPPPAGPTLRLELDGLLRPAIDARHLQLVERGDRIAIVLGGDGLFRSGRATLQRSFTPVLREVADALVALRLDVTVTGHTDSVPLKSSVRYPSNFHLSKARAETVRDALVAAGVDQQVVRAKGKGDTEPLVEETPANRHLNRRVELIVARSST